MKTEPSALNMMKRARSSLTLLAMTTAALAALTMNLFAAPRLVVGKVQGFPGETVSVPVFLRYNSNDAHNVVALQADVLFDARVNVTSTDGTGTALNGHVVRSSQPGAGIRRMLAYSHQNAVLSNGTVASIAFAIPSDMRSNVRLLLDNVILADANGSAIAAAKAEGVILIQQVYVRPGDGNVEGYFSGVPDETPFVIQASTNLAAWVNVFTNSATGSFLEFVDSEAHLYPYRFYRGLPLGGSLASVTSEGGNDFILRMNGIPGRSYVVQASTNLVDWTDVGAYPSNDAIFTFTNGLSGDNPRFFRLRSE